MIDPQEPLGVVALVAHAREVPSEQRERFAAEAAALATDPRIIVLRTCHRAELYAALSYPAEGDRGPHLPSPPSGGRRLEGREAVHHLLSVAAGLDSIVVGEDQILHQLRECLAEGRQAGAKAAPPADDGLAADAPGALDPVLERLFQIALHVGRQSRAWREGPPRSLSDVALDVLEREVGPLAGQSILVVGAGRMGRLAAQGAARRRARVVIANRSPDRASALASDTDGLVVPLGSDADVPDVAGIVVAISGRWDLGSRAAASLLDRRRPVVDLSSPPAIEHELRVALDGRYVSVDDLAHGPRDELRSRLRRRIDRLLESADADFGTWLRTRSSVAAIQALTERAESQRAAELERLLRRLPDMADHDRDLVEQMSRRLVAGLLHAPLATLREDESGERERAARELFGL